MFQMETAVTAIRPESCLEFFRKYQKKIFEEFFPRTMTFPDIT